MMYGNAFDAFGSQCFSGWLRRIPGNPSNGELRGSLGVAENFIDDRAALEPGCPEDDKDLLVLVGAHSGVRSTWCCCCCCSCF